MNLLSASAADLQKSDAVCSETVICSFSLPPHFLHADCQHPHLLRLLHLQIIPVLSLIIHLLSFTS